MQLKIGLIITILLLLVACSPSPSAIPTPEPPAATTQADSPSTLNSGMMTHVDTRSGIAFDYPTGWTILVPSAGDAVIYTYSVASYDMNAQGGIGKESASGVPPGETKIDISFYAADQTPDSARSTVQQDVDSGFAIVMEEETRTSPDGSPAYYYRIQGRLGGEAQVIYTSINGHTVGIVAYGDGANFEAIIKSLRKG